MWDRGKKKTQTIRRKTKISHHHPLCHSPMVKVLGNSSKAGSHDSVVNATLDCWPLIVMYYQTRATRKQPWSLWCQELLEIEHAESQKSGKWVPSEIVMGWSDTMPPLCTQRPCRVQRRWGPGNPWHSGWKEVGGPERQHMLLINSKVMIRTGFWLLTFLQSVKCLIHIC